MNKIISDPHKGIFYIPWNAGYIRYEESTGNSLFLSSINDLAQRAGPLAAIKDDNRHEAKSSTFTPVCLTLFLTNQCNLRCSYCYAPHRSPKKVIDINAAEAAARYVAHNCASTGHAFIVGFHGGGEPLREFAHMKECIKRVRQAARDQGIRDVHLHLTTNGTAPAETAAECAMLFDSITISSDGPPEIQDLTRPLANGGPSSSLVEITGNIFLQKMKNPRLLRVRTTITSRSEDQLPGIVRYFKERWPGLSSIQLEPVYRRGQAAGKPSLSAQPLRFVKGFLEARKEAKGFDISLIYAGSRLDDVHGRFCPVWQKNLSVTPDGFLTSCFCVTERRTASDDQYVYGQYDAMTSNLVIDRARLADILNATGADRSPCLICFNRRHCNRDCPEFCPLDSNRSDSSGTRNCQIQRYLSLATLAERAGMACTSEALDRLPALFS